MEASEAVQSRLIGAIFVEKNLITEEQLEEALHVQETTGERFGEIVVARFGVGRLELAGVLAEQWAKYEEADRKLAPTPDRPDLHVVSTEEEGAQVRRPLGEISIEQGFITSEQLDAALEVQRETGGRIGEILVAQGSLTRLDLASALAEQWSALQKLRPPGPAVEPQPWQNGSPLAPTSVSVPGDSPVVADLEERLQAVERAAQTAPWQDDLNRVTSELRTAVGAVEQRLEAMAPGAANDDLVPLLEEISARLGALEAAPVSSELDSVRRELESLATRPATVEGLADLRAAVERLEDRPDAAAETAHLAGEIAALNARLDELADVGELTDRITAIAGQAEGAQAGLAGLSSRVDDLGGFERRLDELAARLQTEGVIEELRSALAGLESRVLSADHGDQSAEIASLVARLDELAAHVDEVAARPIPDLTPRIDGLSARVEEVVASIPVVETDALVPRIDSLEEESRTGRGAIERLAAELNERDARTREQLDALSLREPDSGPLDEVRARLDELAAAVERGPDLAPVAELRARLDGLVETLGHGPDLAQLDELRLRVNLLAATVEREPDKSALDELHGRVDELATILERDESVGLLEARFGELERRFAAVTPADELLEDLRRVVESSAAERESLAQSLFARVDEVAAIVPCHDELDEIRARLAELAARPIVDRALQERVDGVTARLEGIEGVAGTVAEFRSSLEGLDALRAGESIATETRLDELRSRLDALAGLEARVAEEVDRDLTDHVEAAAARFEGIEHRLGVVHALEERVASLSEANNAHATGNIELGDRLDGALEALRADVSDKAHAFGSQLHEQAAETAALQAQVAALQEAASGQAALEERLETHFAQRLDALGNRFTDEIAAVRGETGSLGAQIDELRLRHRDGQKARAAAQQLAERVDALVELRTEDAEAAQVAAADLASRMDALAESSRAEVAEVRSAADGFAEQISELHGLRADDLATAESAAARLAARLDAEAERSVASAREVERSLKKELKGVAARLDESDAGGIEARKELQDELERAVSSVGWRLERIEESLASDGTAALQAAVAKLERRLAKQAAIGEEQVRVTERALRKGLKSLGERLADTESEYVDAGKAMRRSIERLGAAVVEADARMAHQIPVSEGEGCVAFAPTKDGYRLIELPGKAPNVGSTIELENVDGPLVVTGYGRSPLPLDSRACAYLDRA